jgi:hypothetical protein
VVRLTTFGESVLIVGPSGSGKSTAALSLLEQLTSAGYQYCVIDPEGDYQSVANAVVIGSNERPPTFEAVIQLLQHPANNAIVSLLGVPLAERPAYFAALGYALADLRRRAGRPHWLAIDEAHHVAPIWSDIVHAEDRDEIRNAIFVTVEPAHLDRNILEQTTVVIALGPNPSETIGTFCDAVGLRRMPLVMPVQSGEALVWRIKSEEPARPVRLAAPKGLIRRHRRKYAAGAIDAAHAFHFRGAGRKIDRVAANLQRFIETAEDVDDDVWLFHLRRGDYSHWFEETIKDGELVTEARRAEALTEAAVDASRAIIVRAIEERYTLPA